MKLKIVVTLKNGGKKELTEGWSVSYDETQGYDIETSKEVSGILFGQIKSGINTEDVGGITNVRSIEFIDVPE